MPMHIIIMLNIYKIVKKLDKILDKKWNKAATHTSFSLH